jgi:hypothetical protein
MKKHRGVDMEEREEERVPSVEPAPQSVGPPSKTSLDTYCRSVASRIPVETLSLFYTLESQRDSPQDTYEGFEKRLQELMRSPLG